MARRLGLVTLAGVLACANARPVPTPAPPPPLVVKAYAPLAMRADAKVQSQAVILGTDEHDGSTIVPLLGAPTTIMLGTTSTTPDITITTGPNPDHRDRVRSADDAAQGAVWIAALAATAALDKDITDVAVSVTSRGAVDSAPLAAALIASMTGAKIDPTATVLGVVQPDGTIGPAGDMSDELLAAIAGGKRTVGYPAGSRHAMSSKTGKVIDLETLAAQHGAKAVGVADIYDAYRVLTGTKLPRPVPVASEEMALDADTAAVLGASYKSWQQRLANEWGAILQLESAGRLPPLLTVLRDAAKRNAAQARELYRDGNIGAAYTRIIAATVDAQTANLTYAALAAVQDAKLADAVALLSRTTTLTADVRAALTTLGASHPRTIGEHLRLLAAFGAATRGWVYESVASRALDLGEVTLQALRTKTTAQLGSDAVADTVIQAVVPTLLYVTKTTSQLTLANELANLPAGSRDLEYAASPAELEHVAMALRAATLPNLPLVDGMLVPPPVQPLALTEDEGRARIPYYEPDFLVAFMGSHLERLGGVLEELHDAWGDTSLAWGLFSLAARELAIRDARQSLSVARVARLDDASLTVLLANAERMARAHARAARVATGSIPVQAKLAYQNAIVDARSTSLADKIDALEQLWAASAYSQIAVALARN